MLNQAPEELLEGQLETGFLDPIQLRCLYSNKTQMAYYDAFKADVWALGLIFLEALTLKPSLELYSLPKKLFYEKLLRERLLDASTRYPLLAEPLQAMLVVDCEDRCTTADLMELDKPSTVYSSPTMSEASEKARPAQVKAPFW